VSGLSWLASDKGAERARARRRAWPIHMYVGRNGSGKTLAAVYDTLPDLDASRPVLSTVRLLDFRNPRPCDDLACDDLMHGLPGHQAAHPSYIPFRTWPQLLDFKGGAVLMDEVTGVADSHEGAAMPSAVANKLAQLRRDECMLRITALGWIRANKRIREATNAVTRCQSFLPVTLRDPISGDDRIWRPRRLAVWRTYDAQSLPVDDHTDSAYESADLLVKGRYWIPDSVASRAYDTFAPVNIVGSVSDAGRCAHCGGTRRALECNCPDYVDRKASRRGAGAQAAPAASTGVRLPIVGNVMREVVSDGA
jgi:hypothetical protein